MHKPAGKSSEIQWVEKVKKTHTLPAFSDLSLFMSYCIDLLRPMHLSAYFVHLSIFLYIKGMDLFRSKVTQVLIMIKAIMG